MSEVYEMNIDEIEKYIIGKKIKDMSLEEIKKFIEAQGNTIILNHHVLEKKQQEIDKYKNIVDELEKWLNETQINSPFIDEETIMEVRSKLKELKGE
jgi:predicted metallo-beta-lactamase superfamily hydrolase